ncbi:hypothetical protein ACSV4D_13605 [Flavobacterium sp. ARAG 55.4]|uniref:WG containing repeat-containing protein n=1 Tax=Flavobacterium plantiphilum TaxID=3163297 RepID=A0ABW8XVX3_9FLAO
MKPLLIIFLFSISSCFGQNYSLNDFEECKIPEMDSKEWYDFNHSSNKEFIFTLESGKIKISKHKNEASVEYDIPNGKLIGIDMGEFGGGLYYRPKDSTKIYYVNGKNGKDIKPRWFGGLMTNETDPINKVLKDSKLLKSGNVKFIFGIKDSIYLLGGLSHMALNSGGLYTINFKDNNFLISGALNLEDAPSAMSIYKDCIYLAGNKGFYVIDKNLKLKTIFDNLFWYGLYPASVLVIDKENVFVTIRGGYVKINPEKKTIKLYKAK